MMNYLLVGIGGALGTITRYYFGRYITIKANKDFPLGTLIINITGAFILSFLAFGHFVKQDPYSESIKLFFMTGFLGGYTTFSTLSYESFQLLESRNKKGAVIYIGGTYGLGIVAAYFGMVIGRNF